MLEKTSLSSIEDSTMYSVFDFLDNLGQTEFGMSFNELKTFFEIASVISVEEIIEYIKKNSYKISEIAINITLNLISKGEHIDNIKGDYVERFRQSYPDEYLQIVDVAVGKRENVRECYKEYVFRLKNKAYAYCAIFNYISHNAFNPYYEDREYWEERLRELDITYHNGRILGSDLKRVCDALIKCQTELKKKLEEANEPRTYTYKSIPSYGACSSEEIFPTKDILASLNMSLYPETRDKTSIVMSNRQIEEALSKRKELESKLMKRFGEKIKRMI